MSSDVEMGGNFGTGGRPKFWIEGYWGGGRKRGGWLVMQSAGRGSTRVWWHNMGGGPDLVAVKVTLVLPVIYTVVTR